jgi:hypothetical protein
MKIQNAAVGARCADSLPFSQGGTAAQAAALRARGVDAFVGYLGVINATRVGYILATGMAFMPVTLAGEYEDGPADEVGQLAALGIPAGCTVWLDLEGLRAFHTDPATLIGKINAWADGIAAAGYLPGLYVGSPQPLTSAELYALHVQRYWRGQGRIVDRSNALAEPWGSGWTMTQIFPSVTWGGTLIDVSIVGQDYLGRVPTWAAPNITVAASDPILHVLDYGQDPPDDAA